MTSLVSLCDISPTVTSGDPWKDATVSAEGRDVQSTPLQPVGLSDGFHCSDLSAASGTIDVTVAAVQAGALASMKTWLATWKPSEVSQARPASKASAAGVTQRQAGRVANEKPVNVWFRGAGTL